MATPAEPRESSKIIGIATEVPKDAGIGIHNATRLSSNNSRGFPERKNVGAAATATDVRAFLQTLIGETKDTTSYFVSASRVLANG